MDIDKSLINTSLLPGDIVGTVVQSTSTENEGKQQPVRIGPGLTLLDDTLVAVKAGKLRYDTLTKRYFLENNQKRYICAVGDMVVGTIKETVGESFRVDIGTAHSALLDVTGFDGASRRNRPDLFPGDLIYARVTVANKDLEPEITCLSSQGTARRDWITGQSVFGPLKHGFVINCSLGMSRRLLDPNCELFKQIGDKCSFEAAVGMNGRVWITSEDSRDIVLISNALEYSQHLDDQGIEKMLNTLFKSR
ncbi:exosome complex protein RRP40 [Acrasis kona]|uniref:Ribosomal RNA-processing protein 40 n=1 Tax=Acrasis kona TaxID=1008807 RepID=A0AAW2ZRI4_9EUKA